MPHIDKVVEYVNSQLREGALKRTDMQRGVFYGLAKQVQAEREENNPQPFIYTIEGSEIDPTINDNFPIQLYHRIVSTTYAPSVIQVGDQFAYIQELTTVKAVVYSDYKRIKLIDNDLAFLLIMGMAMNIPKDAIQDLNVNNISITPISADFDSRNVFKSEYGNADFKLNPEDNFFSLTYQIKMDANKNCLSCSDC